MKILHLNTNENIGGAAIAANRLHTALNEHGGCESIMGVQHKQSDNKLVHALQMYNSRILKVFLNRLYITLDNMLKSKNETYFSSYLFANNLVSKIKKFNPDIIHLHWIAHFISPWILEKLGKLNIPIVWTLHDTWAFTGGCHYGKCTRWLDDCRQCPILGRSFGFELAHLQWKLKKKAYMQMSPTIVCPSLSMFERARQSSLLKDYSIENIPNLLDATIFRPIDKSLARELLQLDKNKKYILFGAVAATSDSNKGYDLLASALSLLPECKKSSVHGLVFGSTTGEELSIPTIFLGRVNDAITLTLMYSAADVFVCPSREENLPNTVMESLACGTPVVGFDIGGIPDMVQHEENGYLATPYDTQDLANGIQHVLEDDSRHETMSRRARQAVEEHYVAEIVAKQYMQLYEKILSNNKNG